MSVAEIPAPPAPPSAPTVPAQARAPVPQPKPAGGKTGGGKPAVPAQRNQMQYLSHSILLEEAGTPGLMRMTIGVILLLVVAFLGWASVAKISEVSVAPGAVVPETPVQRIQHLEGGIIAELLVAEGDMVEAGQPLARIDPTQVQAELEQTQTRIAALRLQAERLRSFALDPAGGTRPLVPDVRGLGADQALILDSQRRAVAQQRAVIERQVEQRRQELRTLADQEARVRRSLALLEQEMAMRNRLFEQGLNSRLNILDIERRFNETRGEASRMAGEQARVRQTIEEAEQRLGELTATAERDALAQMGTITAELAQLDDLVTRLRDRMTRVLILSPMRGIVKGITVTTVGGVLAPGAELMQLVPVGDRLIVESRLNPRDVGVVKEGQEALVKISAYDYSRYGGVRGRIIQISPSTFLDERNQPYYRVRIELDQPHIGPNPERNRILPGMTVQADIPTGEKTLMEYLFRPIYLATHEAFRER
ncbi:MAG: HlyD family type I secretion periplasmic adaptor subunit [Alphaproteobacteria bacterium]|nr:MAG: HlyD family type I secretion periplasmic adaptor subunit [Alphaproteobacteria bacterium]